MSKEMGCAVAGIQWKNIEVCMDVQCKCGELFHIDGEGQYITCINCNIYYKLPNHVILEEVSRDEVQKYSWID